MKTRFVRLPEFKSSSVRDLLVTSVPRKITGAEGFEPRPLRSRWSLVVYCKSLS